MQIDGALVVAGALEELGCAPQQHDLLRARPVRGGGSVKLGQPLPFTRF
jgi:hypothetical protein